MYRGICICIGTSSVCAAQHARRGGHRRTHRSIIDIRPASSASVMSACTRLPEEADSPRHKLRR